MKQSQGIPNSASLNMTDMTGRDGAVDHIAKALSVEGAFDYSHFAQVLGQAVIDTWGSLPQTTQEQLFECAVRLGHQTERDEMLREQLAKFLHDHNDRTTHNGR